MTTRSNYVDLEWDFLKFWISRNTFIWNHFWYNRTCERNQCFRFWRLTILWTPDIFRIDSASPFQYRRSVRRKPICEALIIRTEPKLELWTTNLFDGSLITVVTLFHFNLMIKMFILASVYNNADNISDSYDGFKNLTVNIDWLDVKTLIFWRTLIPCRLNFKSLNQALLLN